jgi:hypothetical protein
MESGPIAYFRAKQAEREKSYKDSYNDYMKKERVIKTLTMTT